MTTWGRVHLGNGMGVKKKRDPLQRMGEGITRALELWGGVKKEGKKAPGGEEMRPGSANRGPPPPWATGLPGVWGEEEWKPPPRARGGRITRTLGLWGGGEEERKDRSHLAKGEGGQELLIEAHPHPGIWDHLSYGMGVEERRPLAIGLGRNPKAI